MTVFFFFYGLFFEEVLLLLLELEPRASPMLASAVSLSYTSSLLSFKYTLLFI
jgi:hypothetical protein